MSTQRLVTVLAIVCSLLSLSLLIALPQQTGAWRTSLNVVSLVLVVFATTRIVRARRTR